MNEKNPDILISAYFDGELTPTEREMVEQHLAASPEAQQELDTFGELHALLQSLPHETLSDDFTAEVLQKAERASLLPAAEPTMPQQQPERAPKPRLFVVGSLIATAAALLLMTKLLTSTQPRSTNERSIASKSDSDQNVALVEKAERSRAAGTVDNSTNPPMSDARSARSNIERKGLGQTESMRFKTESAPSGANPPESIRSSKKNFAKESFDSKKKSGVAGIRAKNNPAPPGKVAAGAKAAEGNNLRLLIQRNANRDAIRREVLRKLQKGMIQIGDVVPYFENRGDRTAVVEVVVVDVQKTVNDFQLLLVENAVPAADDNDPRNKKKDQKARKTLPEDGKQMIALYVESSQVQMTTAMKWLTRDSENRQIVLKPPIELDNILLADSGQSRSRLNSKTTIRGSGRSSLADAIEQNRLSRQRKRRFDPRAGTAGEKRSQPEKSSTPKGKPATRKPGNSGKPDTIPKDKKGAPAKQFGGRFASPTGGDNAFHLLVRVPKDAISQQRGGTAQRTMLRKKPGFRNPGRGSSQQLSKDKSRAMRTRNTPVAPLRVIFVFRKPAERKPGR